MVHVSLPFVEKYQLPLIFVGSYAASYMLFKVISDGVRHRRKAPPSLWSMPVLGSMPYMPEFEKWHIYFMEKSRKMGGVIALMFGGRYTIVLNGRKTIYEALVKRSLDFSDRFDFYTNVALINPHGKGIIDHHYGSELRRQHQLTLTILKEFGFGKEIMQERILAEASSLVQYIRDLDGRPFWPDFAVTSHVLNVIVSILFGKRMDGGPLGDLITVIHGFIHDTVNSFPVDFCPVLRFLPFYRREIDSMLDFNRRLFVVIENGIDTSDADSFVQRYIDLEDDRFDKEQLRFMIRDLLLAGTETSASTLLWGLGILAQPDGRLVQERMRTQIDSCVPRGQLPSLSDRPHLPLVDATILELMRIRTVVPLAITHRTIRDTTLNGYFIPSGTMVLPNLYSAHMDPDAWESPEQFRPDRFLDESGRIVGKERVIPFSLGRRSCLGELLAVQELYLFLAAIIQNFTVEPPEGCEAFELREKVSITIMPAEYQVRLIARP